MFNGLKDSGRRIGRLFSHLIPSRYRQDPAVRRSIYKWLLIGLLIRFIFMPIASHLDLLSVYQRSSLVASGRVLWLGIGQTFVHYVHALFLLIFRPLMPYLETMLPAMTGSANWSIWELFVISPNIFRTLFLFKVPYLIFDLGCAFLLLAIFLKRRKGLVALKFWMLNPVVIFAAFIFSRYEPIAIFFILLSLYYARRNLLVKSLFSLGVAVVTRLYPLILLPFFVIILGKGLRQRLKLAFWGLLPLGIMIALSKLFYGVSGVESLAKSYHASYLMSLRFPLGVAYDVIFVFFAGYTVLFLYAYFNTDHSFVNLWKSILCVLLFFFATSFFHPQYFMWLIPFLTLQVVEDKKFIGLFAIQILCWVVYSFQWEEALFGRLFLSLNPSYFMSLPSPFEIINQYYSAANFIGIFRSIFTGTCFWMIYLIFKGSFLGKKKEAV